MIRLYTILILIFFASSPALSQVKEDSSGIIKKADTSLIIDVSQIIHKPVTAPGDTLKSTLVDTVDTVKPLYDSSWKKIINSFAGRSFRELVFSLHPFFAFTAKPILENADIKTVEGKELLFYTMIGLLLVFAYLKTTFAKYVTDLFRLFFRRTLKQRQITEQLSQTPLPSLIFNFFFVVTAGIYLSFNFQHYGREAGMNFWLLALYCSAGLALMYLFKFITLKFTGWVLNLSAITDAYIFIVFIINKVIGVFLLPFLILLAFAQGGFYQVAIALSWCGIVGLYVYRFILSYSAVHSQIVIKPFYFIAYLVAFEIIPLLLIYKLLFRFLF